MCRCRKASWNSCRRTAEIESLYGSCIGSRRLPTRHLLYALISVFIGTMISHLPGIGLQRALHY